MRRRKRAAADGARPGPGSSSRSRRTSRRSRPSARSWAACRPAARPWSPRSTSSTRGWGRGSTRPDRPPSAGTCPRATRPRPRPPRPTTAEALGHLQAFGLRTIGELQTRIVHEEDWADAWKAYFPVLRVGRRLVIRPTWRRHRRAPDDVVLALDPGMAFGTGLHPTTRLCLAALEVDRRRRPSRRGTRPRRRLWLGHPRDRGREARGVRRPSASIPTRSPSSRRWRTRAATGSPGGSAPGSAACRAASRRSTWSSPTSSPACWCRSPAPCDDELRPGGTLVASGIFIDREAEVRAAFEAGRAAGSMAGRRRATGSRWWPAALDRARDPTRPGARPASRPAARRVRPVPSGRMRLIQPPPTKLSVEPSAVHAIDPPEYSLVTWRLFVPSISMTSSPGSGPSLWYAKRAPSSDTAKSLPHRLDSRSAVSRHPMSGRLGRSRGHHHRSRRARAPIHPRRSGCHTFEVSLFLVQQLLIGSIKVHLKDLGVVGPRRRDRRPPRCRPG